MSAATAQPPIIPPRPSRSQERSSIPMVPPRPANRRAERSMSPNHDRFAPSPLNEGFLSSKSGRPSRLNGDNGELSDSKSVNMPSIGQEGMEYAGLAALSPSPSNNPEQTRTVGDDLKLHAPKPSLPAVSAKQRVMTVTRTDSDKAASFGIGRPSSNEDSTTALPSGRSLRKKASTASQLSTNESHHEDEHGIPEIGVQVPMYPNAGDVQAPSPAPGSLSDAPKGRHHARKTSSRGNLPPGSYGLHGHGVGAQDKLEKAYFDKHPDLLKKEHTSHHHDRPYDFSMSSDDLNKIVRETASRGAGLAVNNYSATPTDQIGWQAIEESTSRVASPRPGSAEFKSPVKGGFTTSDSEKGSSRTPEEKEVIHIDDPKHKRKRSILETAPDDDIESPYTAPILAEDEVAKDPGPYDYQPAVEPVSRNGEEPSSRPTSRPASLYKEPSFEVRSTPLEDVEEYEPLFSEEEKEKPLTKEEKIKKEQKRRFPSADIWEDAPSSVHYTAEVSTPEPAEEREKESTSVVPPPRDGETPAQAFARHQEELAERETRERGPEAFLPQHSKKPTWTQHQTHLATETTAPRPTVHRFPSRDIWEDAPDSLQLETTVSTPQQDEETSPVESKPEILSRPQAKPALPDRPKPRQGSGDNNKPAISDRPKPQIPARPAKAGPTSGGLEPAEAAAPPRQKPAVPARPMGSKIAALQAGFMSDLNKRLQLGPQAPKKEESAADEEPVEEKEKAPLADARKGRARGPQRRAPAKSASPAPAAAPAEAPKLAFSMTVTVFDIDPEEGIVSVGKTSAVESMPESELVEEANDEAKEEAIEQPEEEAKAEVQTEEQEDDKEDDKEETKVEIKTLATNMAGEAVVAEHIKKDKEGQTVEPTAVEER